MRLNSAWVLPQPPTPLVGREREVAAAVEQLGRGVRLLTLVGPGGIGKTRLALELARRVAPAGGNGAAFVDLADVADSAQVTPTICRALDVRESGDPRTPGTPLERLVAALQDQALLLVLDTFEQVVEAASELSVLLERCPGLRVLVTSRAPLHLRWEYEFPVPPLALPPPRAGAGRAGDTGEFLLAGDSAGGLAPVAAVELFVLRARAVRPDFELTGTNEAAIASICRRLDGLPLAIELAASGLRVLSPQALNALLDAHGLDVLPVAPRDAHARQRSLRSTIDWSVSRLAPPERALLRQLGVFAGGATVAAITAICPAAGDARSALERVTTLADQSLLRSTEDPSGTMRFSQLETILEYARGALATAGELSDVATRHATYFATQVEHVEPLLYGADQADWLDRLDGEWSNLRAALEWWLGRARDGDAAAAGAGLRLATNLLRYWIQRGRHGEGRAWLRQMLEASQDGREMLQERPAHPDLAHSRGAALLALARLAVMRWDFPEARRFLGEVQRLARVLGDGQLSQRATLWLGVVETNDGQPDRALPPLAAAGACPSDPGWTWDWAYGQLTLGRALAKVGDLARAADALTAALQGFNALGDTWAATIPLVVLGAVALRQRDVARARTHGEQAVVYARRSGDPWVKGIALQELGQVAIAERNFDAATALIQESAALFRSIGNTGAHADCLADLDGIREARGRQSAIPAPEPAASPAGAPQRASAHASLRVAGAPDLHALTAREIEVLRLVAQGLTNVQAAERLVISPVTVSAHLRVIFSKLGVTSRTAAARAIHDANLL